MSLGMTIIGVVDGKAPVLMYIGWQNPHLNQWKILLLFISTKLRSLDTTLLYCIDSDWTTLNNGGKILVSLGSMKIEVLNGKAPVLVCMHGKISI